MAREDASSATLVRLVDELLWALRRGGFVISTAQAIDAARAVAAVGLERRSEVRDALSAVVVQRAIDRGRFERTFDRFFAVDAATRRGISLWDRLSAGGFEDAELGVLRELLAQLGAASAEDLRALGTLLDRGAELDWALARLGVASGVDAHHAAQLGFLTHRALARVGIGGASRALAWLRSHLVDALGPRGASLADALASELEEARAQVRSLVHESHEAAVSDAEQRRSEHRLSTLQFAELTDAEIEEVRASVRRFAERLRGGARVRQRRWARSGRIDPHRTLRGALRSGGVPFELVRKPRRRGRPRLVVLCDVSESVRAVASFLLEFTYAVQELFDRTRSFVFVSDLGETTELFSRLQARQAIAQASGVVSAGENSNYGRVLRLFEERHARTLDRRTTLVILGDGRNNYHDPAVDVLGRIRERSRAVIWLCPEPRSRWGQGDSAMGAYADKCTSVFEVCCAADLERAARTLVGRS